ncbi:E3 ubiquitin/ISG15 ligase TRIM25-like isoform X5 [Falco biarmicus]|uniref:E3 ubiquitin/ISG15 ligase TRIM25-like isoform X5 n=1 Tax=Falco biarmicus TaxID=345155 RepID=UPI0024BC7A12|nr:E3 ubiquitin/ISG15 ligase TRIM25-like isoform X5 [Falco biarmicus]
MAKAKEGYGRGASLEDELSCPICLSLYRDPVLLSCGHSFCKQCIQKALSAQQQSKATYSCPVCQLQLGPILDLQKNFQLCSIVEAFLATTSKEQQDEGSAEEKEVVPCDFCLDWSQPAVKTCLNCDASLCQAHLNKHNAKASQQDHVLVEVGAGGLVEERKCLEHGRLLECYCQDDRQYICMLCSIAGCHKGHNILSLKETHDRQLSELMDIVTWLQECKSALATALEELQETKNQLKTNTETVTSQLQMLFEEMKTEMTQKEKKILSDIQSNEKKQLAYITKVKKKMEQRRHKAAQHLQSLQKMKEQTDVFLFLKEFKLAKDRIRSQNFCVEGTDMVVVQLDQARIDCCRRLMWDFMSHLGSLLEDVHSELTNQIKRNSGASDTGTSSNCSTFLPIFSPSSPPAVQGDRERALRSVHHTLSLPLPPAQREGSSLSPCSSVGSLPREPDLQELLEGESFPWAAPLHELLQCGSLPQGDVLQEQAAPAWGPRGVTSPARSLLQPGLLSPWVHWSCQEPSHGVRDSFGDPPALAWDPPRAAVIHVADDGWRAQQACGAAQNQRLVRFKWHM